LVKPPSEPTLTSLIPPDPRVLTDFYALGDILGTGSYSVVKMGTSVSDPTIKVAVKILSRAKMKAEDEAGILREVDIMRSLDHPNIVKMHDFFHDENYFYVVMEYVSGGELFERLVEKAVYTEEEARNIALVMFQALKYMHDKDLVHR
jgi:serine/threonine protein kinase